MSFRILGIPVAVRPAFLLLVVFLGYGRLQRPEFFLELGLAAFISTLWHELGHALAFRKFGLSPSIELHGMGGTTSCKDVSLSRGRHMIASLSGPVFGLLLAGGLVLAARSGLLVPQSRLSYTFLHDLLWINLAWSAFNLVPILPMDGGQVLQDLLRSRWAERGDRAARWVSLILAAAGTGWAALRGETWIAFLGFWFGSLNWRALEAQRAERACLAVLSKLDAKELDAAWSEFKKIPPEKVHEHLLPPLASALFAAGRFNDSLQLEAVSYYRTKNAAHALNAARCLERLGRGPEAQEWLDRVKERSGPS